MTTFDPIATTVNCNYCGNVFAKERHLRKHVRKSHFRLAAAEELELSPRSKKQKMVIDDQSEEHPHKEDTDPVPEGDTGADDEAETSEHKYDQLGHCESIKNASCVIVNEDHNETEDEDVTLDEECITETEFNDATGELPGGEDDAEVFDVPAEEILEELLDIVVDLAKGRRTSSLRSSRRSRGTPVTYNENSDDEDSLQYKKIKSKESQAKESPHLKMKKEAEASIIIDDESFQLLESRMNEQKGKKGKRKSATTALESIIISTPLVTITKSRETRRSVSYNEDSDEEKSYSKLSMKQLAKINRKAEENAERIIRKMQQSGRKGNNPKIKQAVNKYNYSDGVSRRIDYKSRLNHIDNASKKTRRSCRNSANISYVETSDEEVEIVEEARPSRRGRGRPGRQSREPSSDIVLYGEAVTGSLEDAALLTLADSVYGVEAEGDEEDLVTVEITPLASKLRSRRSGDRGVVQDSRRPAREQGKRYDCGLCHEIVFSELKMNLHMKLRHRMLKSNRKKEVQNIVKNVKVMIKNEKLKPTKPKLSLRCTFRK